MRRIFFVAIFASIGLYQNCSPSYEEGGGNGTTSSSSITGGGSSYEETLPLAYVPRIDTLAYMSCSEMQNGDFEPRAYFSFRAGAYNSLTGGLAMSQDFRTATAYYTNTDRGNALAMSSNNANTLLTLSIRSRSNLQSLWATDEVSVGGEVDQFLPELDSPSVAGPFASLGVDQFNNSLMINYFPGDDQQRLMEASLRFVKYENVANDTRNNLGSGASLLVVGFSKSGDVLDPGLRTQWDFPDPNVTATTPKNNMAFGVGYLVPFSLPAGYASGDRRVIAPSGLQEIDLTTNKTMTSTWDCAQNYEFMIIRPEDRQAGRVSCNAGVDRPNGSTQQTALNAVRRVLRVEDWFVDLDNHCVIPKRTGDYCYGTTLGTRQILYGVANCVDDATHACPHFVSVCIRH